MLAGNDIGRVNPEAAVLQAIAQHPGILAIRELPHRRRAAGSLPPEIRIRLAYSVTPLIRKLGVVIGSVMTTAALLAVTSKDRTSSTTRMLSPDRTAPGDDGRMAGTDGLPRIGAL